jgi:hypothetical protein
MVRPEGKGDAPSRNAGGLVLEGETILGRGQDVLHRAVVEGRDRPHADELSPDNLLTYRYRGTDPAHRDNLGLRLAMGPRAPLIYFYGLVPASTLEHARSTRSTAGVRRAGRRRVLPN